MYVKSDKISCPVIIGFSDLEHILARGASKAPIMNCINNTKPTVSPGVINSTQRMFTYELFHCNQNQ